MNEVDEQTGDNNRLSSSVVSAPRQAEGGAGPWRPVWVRSFRTFRRRRSLGGRAGHPSRTRTRTRTRRVIEVGCGTRRLSAVPSLGRAVQTAGDANLPHLEVGRGRG